MSDTDIGDFVLPRAVSEGFICLQHHRMFQRSLQGNMLEQILSTLVSHQIKMGL